MLGKKGENDGKGAHEGSSSSKREGGSGREADARPRGRPAAALQPDVLSAPTVLQRDAKLLQPRTSQRALPTDAILGVLPSADASPPISMSRGHGGRGLKFKDQTTGGRRS